MKPSNYDIMKEQMQSEFLKYDLPSMIKKFDLQHDSEYLYIRFFSQDYRISRSDGRVERLPSFQVADYNEAMTIYDVLCCSKPGCVASGEFLNMSSLSAIQSATVTSGTGLFGRFGESLAGKSEALRLACESLGGRAEGKGDVAYRLPMFDFMDVLVSFWDEDDDFPASIHFLVDKNILDYMHYETVAFALIQLMNLLQARILG